ncbi:YlbL family protein [Dethiobacter alkaliphilus]|uniref:YlbL family protein n=1 Tax=Dethiobacter alkaliphilus TaxID=427926 RepID=UPI002226FFE9|nr:PDZ domain-containing protein [Dethiobacter alkaliphilus]MCW3489925.1 PDZ domain-containing protein [Dethiobacter alkaliphilus]
MRSKHNLRRLVLTIVTVLFIGYTLLFVPTGYLLVRPGSAEDLAGFVTVEEGDKDHSGRFYLVTVMQQDASPLLLVYGLVNPIIDLQLQRQVVPPHMDPEEFRDLMEQWMQESQNLASTIALRRLGFDVPVESDGVKVAEVGEDSPAQGILETDDIILAVDGREVYLAEELINAVQSRPVGDPVRLRITRDRQMMDVSIPTTNHTDQPEKAAIRVFVQTLNWQPRLPRDVTIDVGQIGGPSAGLMFVLEIINQLDPRDLTAGRQIAGTGTINLQEEVGSIGGVRQKVRAAENAGAEYFFVPQENYEEAVMAVRHIELVPVETLGEALQFLEGLQE